MRPVAIFFHGLFFLGEPPKVLTKAVCIIARQVGQLHGSGLWDEAQEIHFGINGGEESQALAKTVIPEKATVTFHGLQCRSENRTILILEEWVKTHPGWYVLYIHAKGCTHKGDGEDAQFGVRWREGMMYDLVTQWRRCVNDLQMGYDITTSQWLWNMADGTQHIPCGNFLWVKTDFVAKLPSITSPARIKQDGLEALSSRYEAEVYWGNGPTPRVKSYREQPYWWRLRPQCA